MKEKSILTAESVTEGHLDKLCDQIADAVLDECLRNDPNARVACEVMATYGKVIVAGEITATIMPDIPYIVCRTIRHIGYENDYEVEVITHDQSADIAGAVKSCSGNKSLSLYVDPLDGRLVENCSGNSISHPGSDTLGAGDQGVMYGHACSETDELLPLLVVMAHRMTSLLTAARRLGTIKGLQPDGKAQVSVEYRNGKPFRLAAVVVSCQHTAKKKLDELRFEVMKHIILPVCSGLTIDDDTQILINPSGRFVLGGFEADTGLTGRKLMVDTYGGIVPHGGGALSGKDGTKVDRSGAYMARFIAKNIVAAGIAERCTVSLAYAIGKAEPVAVDADTHDTGKHPDEVIADAVREVFDLTPAGMIRTLRLDQPIYAAISNYGHFTHADAPWEQTSGTDELKAACAGAERS